MPKKLNKAEQETWDRLNYVPPAIKDKAWAYSASHTAPHNALPGSIYFDMNRKQMMIYDGTTWKAVP